MNEWRQVLLDTPVYAWMDPKKALEEVNGLFFNARLNSLKFEWIFQDKKQKETDMSTQSKNPLTHPYLQRLDTPAESGSKGLIPKSGDKIVPALQSRITKRGQLRWVLDMERVVNAAQKSWARKATIRQMQGTILERNAQIRNLKDELMHVKALLRGHQTGNM